MIAQLLVFLALAVGGSDFSLQKAGATDIARLPSGDLVLAKPECFQIVQETVRGRVTPFAGTGVPGFERGPLPARQMPLQEPFSLIRDIDGNLYISDRGNHAVYKWDHQTGLIRVVAGNGEPGFAGDGQSPSTSQLRFPTGLALDEIGRLYVADTGNNRIRRIDFGKDRIETVAGNGEPSLPTDGELAVDQPLEDPVGLAIQGRFLWITSRDGNSVYRMRLGGSIRRIVGTGEMGVANGKLPASQSPLSQPEGVLVGPDSRLYISDTGNNRVWRVDVGADRMASVGGIYSRPVGLLSYSPAGPIAIAERNHNGWTVGGPILETGGPYTIRYRDRDEREFARIQPHHYFGTTPNPYNGSYYGPYYYDPITPVIYYGTDHRPGYGYWSRFWPYGGIYQPPYFGFQYYPWYIDPRLNGSMGPFLKQPPQSVDWYRPRVEAAYPPPY